MIAGQRCVRYRPIRSDEHLQRFWRLFMLPMNLDDAPGDEKSNASTRPIAVGGCSSTGLFECVIQSAWLAEGGLC